MQLVPITHVNRQAGRAAIPPTKMRAGNPALSANFESTVMGPESFTDAMIDKVSSPRT